MEQIKQIIFFFSFQDYSINIVLLSTFFLAISSGLLGVLTVLNHRALIVDAVAHSVLPGVCFGFILSGTKNPIYLILGGFIFGFLSIFLIDFIQNKSKIKSDSSIAIVLSFLFSLGILVLNYIQNSGNIEQSGLTDFLFGKASALMQQDVYVFLFFLIIVIVLILLLFNRLKIFLFDKIYAKTLGVSGVFLQFILSVSIVVITSIGIQTVGVVLMSALLIAPASSALMWQNSLGKVLFVSVLFSAISSVLGVLISYISPLFPTGPSIVICLCVLAYFSFLFSPKGIFQKKRLHRKNKNIILVNNVLKSIYKIESTNKDKQLGISLSLILQTRKFNKEDLNKVLKKLIAKRLIIKKNEFYFLTTKGRLESENIIKKHVLWEMYLSEHLNLSKTYIHESAESIEHILTPELTRELEVLFKNKTQNQCKL